MKELKNMRAVKCVCLHKNVSGNAECMIRIGKLLNENEKRREKLARCRRKRRQENAHERAKGAQTVDKEGTRASRVDPGGQDRQASREDSREKGRRSAWSGLRSDTKQ